MRKLRVYLEPSQSYETISITLSELGLTEDEWKAKTAEEQQSIVQEYIDEGEQPYWIVDQINEVE